MIRFHREGELLKTRLDFERLEDVVGGHLNLPKLDALFLQDVDAELDTFVTNVHTRPRDQPAHISLRFSAK
jgi:hypothetical protein